MFVVLSGSVEVREGNQVVAALGAGQVLGEDRFYCAVNGGPTSSQSPTTPASRA
jgi:hypothetical protein